MTDHHQSSERTAWRLATCQFAEGPHVSTSHRLHPCELQRLIHLNIIQPRPLETRPYMERTARSPLLCSADCNPETQRSFVCVQGHALTPAVAFPALALFNLMRMPLILLPW